MDFNAPFSISNGNSNATDNGVSLNNPPAPLLCSSGSDLTVPCTNTETLLPGFETLFSGSSSVPSYANDPLRGDDLDSFLAEQGQEFNHTENIQPQLAIKSSAGYKVLQNGSANSIHLRNSLIAASVNKDENKSVSPVPVNGATNKMSGFAAEENFMGFQPLDSNGNTSDGSPRVSPLKMKSSLAGNNVERGSADTSMESESDTSDSENDYKSAEDGVDSANPDAGMVVDEEKDSATEVDDDGDGGMEVDEVVGDDVPGDVSDGPTMEQKAAAEIENGSDKFENKAAEVKSNDEAEKKNKDVGNNGADMSDAKDKNTARKEEDENVTDSDTDEMNETELGDDDSNLDHSYSQKMKSDVDKMDADTETEDEGKLVIDDGDETTESKADDGQSSDVDIEGTNGAKSPRDTLILFKKQKKTTVDIGFKSQTPELPDFSDSKSMCWCGGEETPEMIACDSPRCKIVWYHYSCVNVKPDEIPEGDWYCPTCKEGGLDNKERPPDTARLHIKLSQDDEEPNKRRRKQTLKAREAATEDDIDFEITVNDDDSDHDRSFTRKDMVDDPLTGGKVIKKEKKPPKVKLVREFDSGSEGEFELPSWHGNPKELFEGMPRPHGPRAIKLKKPFEHGWAREIVVRFKYENLKGSGRPPMDVYYFTPEGKKLRSLVQIADYLAETNEDFGLTTDNFSLNRIPVHKEPWENIRMANIGRSAGSAKGAQSKRGRPSLGRGKGKPIMGSINRPIGRPPKNSPGGSPRPLYMPLAEEKEEPKSFPEMLNLKPVVQKPATDTPSGPPVPSQKARKSFRPTELPKRLLNPLEQSMPDPKRPKLKAVQGDRHENHIQLHNEGGFRLCSLECAGRGGKPPELHCGVCMCLFHPECVQFVGNTSAALFVCNRCRKQPVDSSKQPVVITGSLFASGSKYTPSALSGLKTQLAQSASGDFTNIPKTIEPLSDVMMPLTIEKASHDNETPQNMLSPPLSSPLVPPPPVLKPMTVAAHLKSMEHENKKQNVVSWSFTEGNLKFTNSMPKPPPLKTVRAQLAQLPSLTTMPTMPTLASKPTVVTMSPTSVCPTSVSAVRNALNYHSEQTTAAVGVSGSPAIMTSANSNDIRMAGQLLTLPGNIINRIKMNEPLALKINNQSLVVNPDCFVQTSHGVKIFLPPNTLPVQTGNKTINITVPQTTSSVMPATTVSHSITSTIQASSCTPIVVGSNAGTVLPGIQKNAMPEMANSAFVDLVSNVPHLKSGAEQNATVQSKTFSPDLPSQPVMIGQGLIPVQQELLPTVQPNNRSQRKVQPINPAACFIKQLHGGYDSLLQIFSYLSVPDLLKVSQVCRRWRSIVTESWMWRTVRLRGTYVTDWDTAMNFLQKVGTKKLDLRGLRHVDDRNRTWHQITGVLDKMTDLNVIHFGQCPASILHAVTEKVIDLKVLTAEWITEIFEEPQMWTTNTKLDMAKFAKMPHLEELRVRGVCGLVLPSFSFSGGLEELCELKKLKKLSLTTLKEVSGSDFNFIGQLTNLEELEIGDCTLWTEETYSQLSKLENLRILRLENGGDLEDSGLAGALKCLKELTRLELVMFIIPSTLKDALSELTNLHELSVWPDPRDQPALVNTNALNAVKNLTHLTKLEWGVVTSEDSEERAENEDQGNLAFLRSAFEEKKTSEKSDSEAKSEKTSEGEESETTNTAMETDADCQGDDNEGDKEEVSHSQTSEEVITTQKLHDRLSGMLIETKVTINDVAVLSSGRSRTTST